MKTFVLALALTTVVVPLAAQEASTKKSTKARTVHAAIKAQNAFTPDAMKWQEAPPSVPPGGQMAILEGNPNGVGRYTFRVKIPDGYKVAPHWHPRREEVTVVSGTLKLGMGDTWDDAKMSSYAAGSFAYLDPNMHHFAEASGETVIQIAGMGPFKINYVNPLDNPNKNSKGNK